MLHLPSVADCAWIDDDERADPPEAVTGMNPGIGYRLTNWANVGRGLHEIWTETYVIDPAKFRKLDTVSTLVSGPLDVTVHWAS